MMDAAKLPPFRTKGIGRTPAREVLAQGASF
jgi:hypothetical protein